MKNKYLIYESGYLLFDVTQTEKKGLHYILFKTFLSYLYQLFDYTLKLLENYSKI